MKFRRIKNYHSLTAAIISAPSVLCLYFLAFRKAPCLPFEIFRLAQQVCAEGREFLSRAAWVPELVRLRKLPLVTSGSILLGA